LVAIAVGIGVPVFIFSNRTSDIDETPIAISIGLDYSESGGKGKLIIKNNGGGTLTDAFSSDGKSWNNMNVIINVQSGSPPNLDLITGCQDFSPGCNIIATYDVPLPEDSSISITYIPADQLILNEELSEIIKS
jgi:hypothetical protein